VFQGNATDDFREEYKGERQMSARNSAVRLFIHAGMVVGAIFAVTILLAAMPGHNAPSVETISEPQQQSAAAQPMPSMLYGSMRMDLMDEKANETAAVSDMSQMHASSEHLQMTEMRPQTPADVARALLRAVSTLLSRLQPGRRGVEMSLDAARKSACATSHVRHFQQELCCRCVDPWAPQPGEAAA
jgi:hypothetical protein